MLPLALACSSPEPTADLRAPAEKAAREWIDAMRIRDSEKLATISHDPFYFDDETPVTGADILRMYRLPGLLDSFRGLESQTLTTSTLAAYRTAVGDEGTGRLTKALSLKPDDYIVEAKSFALVVRFVNAQPKILAYWD